MSYNTDNMASVWINNVRVANLLSVENSLIRDWSIVDNAIATTHKEASVVLSRTVYFGQGLPDKVSFFGLENFILEIRYPRYKLTFSGCQWISHKEKLTNDNTVIETMEVVAKTCNVVTMM